jgi:antirestriction protein ArdC
LFFERNSQISEFQIHGFLFSQDRRDVPYFYSYTVFNLGYKAGFDTGLISKCPPLTMLAQSNEEDRYLPSLGIPSPRSQLILGILVSSG